jgi:glycosyltransferase involved in cell wall biosynthesis
VEELLQAFSHVRRECQNLKLLVVGGGNLAGHYQRLAQQLGGRDRVVFAGRVDNETLPACYAASDFAVLPSRDSSEGFGLALMEAMACGKAVIGSEAGGIPEVIENSKNGILVRPRDPIVISQAIQLLYENDELRIKMGQAGREFSKGLDWSTIADRVAALYAGLGRAGRESLESLHDSDR